MQKNRVSKLESVMNTRYGAGDRTRTGTLSPAVDFESTTSTNSITPADSEKMCVLRKLFPVAVPDKIFGLTLFLDFIDRCQSLSSLLLPQAALASLPITPAGA